MMYKNNLCKKIILAGTILCISNSTHSIEQVTKNNSNRAKDSAIIAGIVALAYIGSKAPKATTAIIGGTTILLGMLRNSF